MPTLVHTIKYLLFGLCLAMAFSVKAFGADAPAPAHGDGRVDGQARASEPVEVEGVITTDATWSGRVLVVGDVLVPEGVTLTVVPGTVVMFARSDSSKIEPMFLSMQTELLVRGTLVVDGLREDPVRFLPAPEEHDMKAPERGDWGGLIFDGGSASKSVVRCAIIEMADTGVAAYRSSPGLADCRIMDSRYGLVAADGAAPRLAGCVIRGGEFGVVSYRGGRPALDGCTVEGNEHDTLTRD